MKKFEVGKTYLSGNVRAEVVKRTPLSVTVNINGQTFKGKVENLDSVEGYSLEQIIIKDFPSKKEHVTFWADCLKVEKVIESAKVDEPKRYNFLVPDLYTAILLIESKLDTFTIKHQINGEKVEFCDCYYAENCVGDSMEIHDNFVRVEVKRGHEHSVTTFWLDIPESKFIAEMNRQTLKAQTDFCNLTKFEIVGDGNTIYTYDEQTLLIIKVKKPAKDIFENNGVEPFENVAEVPAVETPIADDAKEYSAADYIVEKRRLAQYREISAAANGHAKTA